MVTICHAIDDVELLLLRSALEAAGVPYFVVGQHFGSLFPGIQISSYNERSIQVEKEFVDRGLKVVEEVRRSYIPASANLTTQSKLRMILEGLFFGWVASGGTKKESRRA